jgi:hypothetical protein
MEKRKHYMKNSFETRNNNGWQYNKLQQKELILYLLVDKFYTVIKTKISVWQIFKFFVFIYLFIYLFKLHITPIWVKQLQYKSMQT